MAVEAEIITKVINDVILVPSEVVQTTNGQSTVRVMKNGQISTVTIEVAGSNDTQTAITSGLNEGDEVVTSITSTTTARTSTTGTSVFGSTNRGFGGGGGNVRGAMIAR